MKLFVPCEGRFSLHEGQPASNTWSYDQYWTRFLTVFDSVTVISRLTGQEDAAARPITGPGVDVIGLPLYTGPIEYLGKRAEIKARLREALDYDSAYLLTIPGTIGGLVWRMLEKKSHPYAVEVIGDPYDTMAPGAQPHPLRPFFRWWMPRELRNVCRGAIAGTYVTEEALQRRYPCPAHQVGISSVGLPDDRVVPEPRPLQTEPRRLRLILVGNVNQYYKAPDILIKAVAECVRSGLDLELEIVGDGQYRGALEELARDEGIGDRVSLPGRVQGGDEVFAKLDAADLFVLPSYQEGLPRAMVEAMARGLPCIGSTVGGFPELLPPEYLVTPGDVEELAGKIRNFASNPERMQAASQRNLQRAGDYRDSVLSQKRNEFFRYVHDETARRLAAKR